MMFIMIKKTSEFIDLLKKYNIYFLVYDIKDEKSAGNIDYWIDIITKIKEDLSNDLIYTIIK